MLTMTLKKCQLTVYYCKSAVQTSSAATTPPPQRFTSKKKQQKIMLKHLSVEGLELRG